MPSTAILDKKKQAVADLAEQIKNSPAGVIVNYEGISVENDTKLRKALRENGVTYKVVKNTLTSRACAEAGLNGISKDTCLNGMTAIAIASDNPIAPAKVIKEYAAKIESFTILAGYLDGAVIDVATVEELAGIPTREVMIAKILGSIQSPLYKLANLLSQIAEKQGGEAEAPATQEAPAEA
ncbi:MAG: 50S ribosomal protein L10 [Clostridia bacterium]|nr:50S ribosomal protein L10 [Clostridia bacterium]MBQ7727042.1 50S ribosomal protein L10 [Clostridia bacterium]